MEKNTEKEEERLLVRAEDVAQVVILPSICKVPFSVPSNQ